MEGATGNAPNGRCNWKCTCVQRGQRRPGQGSTEPTAQAHSDTPALSFCSFISAQEADGMQLQGNLLDKETLPGAASTEFCLAKQPLQMKMCQSRAGIWSTTAPQLQPKSTRKHSGEQSTQRPCHNCQASGNPEFLCLSVPWFALAQWEPPGWCSSFPRPAHSALGQREGRVGEPSTDQGLQLSPEHRLSLCLSAQFPCT